jgi:hypothetical protein
MHTTPKSLKKIILFSIILNLSLSCSVAPGYKFATLTDQVNNAGAIVEATAGKNFAKDKINFGQIKFSNVRFLKGCGPKEIIVEGFKNSAACGAGIPKKDQKVILFLCKGSDESNWVVNDFKVSTGVLFLNNKKNYSSQIKTLVLNKFGSLGKCSTLSECKKKIDNKPPVKPVDPPKEKCDESVDIVDNIINDATREINAIDVGSLVDISELSEISNLTKTPVLDVNTKNLLKDISMDSIKLPNLVLIGDSK